MLPKCQIVNFDSCTNYHSITQLHGSNLLYLVGDHCISSFDPATGSIVNDRFDIEMDRQVIKVVPWEDKLIVLEEGGRIRVVSVEGDGKVDKEIMFEDDIVDVVVH